MPSANAWKSIEKAREKGAFAGVESALPLWNYSKRELVELALRLGSQAAGEADDAEAGVRAVEAERESLARAGII
mgnify:CR=1 FL=1